MITVGWMGKTSCSGTPSWVVYTGDDSTINSTGGTRSCFNETFSEQQAVDYILNSIVSQNPLRWWVGYVDQVRNYLSRNPGRIIYAKDGSQILPLTGDGGGGAGLIISNVVGEFRADGTTFDVQWSQNIAGNVTIKVDGVIVNQGGYNAGQNTNTLTAIQPGTHSICVQDVCISRSNAKSGGSTSCTEGATRTGKCPKNGSDVPQICTGGKWVNKNEKDCQDMDASVVIIVLIVVFVLILFLGQRRK